MDNIWEPTRDVLDLKENKVGSTLVSSYDYTVNAIGQRTGVTTSGTAFPATPSWAWGYDSLGQVITADSSINTSDRAYEYDAIGNRKKSANSLTLPGSDNYTSNALNQYSSLSIPDPQSPISNPLHDDDGNQIDSQVLPPGYSGLESCVYQWDAENRLVSATVGTLATTYLYDALSRRIARTTAGTTIISVYDAWNCISEYISEPTSPSYVLFKSNLWGTDLSATLQGAGGVGGLLCVSVAQYGQPVIGGHVINPNHIPAANYYPTYDGNGNVSEYLAANGSIESHFEYDPFGNPTTYSMSSTILNSHMLNVSFSTKPMDPETGLYYYGYRYYDPVTGRWPSRDPKGENYSTNLYDFLRGNGINKIDVLGLLSAEVTEDSRANSKADNLWSYTFYLRYFGDGKDDYLKIMLVSLKFRFEWCDADCKSHTEDLAYSEWFLLNTKNGGMASSRLLPHYDVHRFARAGVCSGKVVLNAEYGVSERGKTSGLFGLANQNSWVVNGEIGKGWGTITPGRFDVTNGLKVLGNIEKWGFVHSYVKGDGCCSTAKEKVDSTTWTGVKHFTR